LASNPGGVRGSDDRVDHAIHRGGESFQFRDRSLHRRQGEVPKKVNGCPTQNELAGSFPLTVVGAGALDTMNSARSRCTDIERFVRQRILRRIRARDLRGAFSPCASAQRFRKRLGTADHASIAWPLFQRAAAVTGLFDLIADDMRRRQSP